MTRSFSLGGVVWCISRGRFLPRNVVLIYNIYPWSDFDGTTSHTSTECKISFVVTFLNGLRCLYLLFLSKPAGYSKFSLLRNQLKENKSGVGGETGGGWKGETNPRIG